jgi:formate dehydrogenase subunit gamma
MMVQEPMLVGDIIDGLKFKPGALLPILHAIQGQYGFIPDEAIGLIASSLHQTKAEIDGVISFYHHFRTSQPGAHTIEVCRAEACQSMGGRTLEAYAKTKLGIDFHQTTSDRQFSLDAVYCLGNCANAPSVRINDDIHGRTTLDKFDHLLDECSVNAGGA